jgi:hypothetical protein
MRLVSGQRGMTGHGMISGRWHRAALSTTRAIRSGNLVAWTTTVQLFDSDGRAAGSLCQLTRDAVTVTELFKCHSLQTNGPVRWGEPVLCDLAGIYVVTLNPDPACNVGIPTPAELSSMQCERWLPEQPIVYIGKAGGPSCKSTVARRMSQFYRHQWGERSPHRGGQDVKVLLPHRLLWLFWAPTPEPRAVERQMLAAFVAAAGRRPFANRQG